MVSPAPTQLLRAWGLCTVSPGQPESLQDPSAAAAAPGEAPRAKVPVASRNWLARLLAAFPAVPKKPPAFWGSRALPCLFSFLLMFLPGHFPVNPSGVCSQASLPAETPPHLRQKPRSGGEDPRSIRPFCFLVPARSSEQRGWGAERPRKHGAASKEHPAREHCQPVRAPGSTAAEPAPSALAVGSSTTATHPLNFAQQPAWLPQTSAMRGQCSTHPRLGG